MPAEDAISRHFFTGFIRLHVLYHAAREPIYTVMVGVATLVLGSGLALSRMGIDIFPTLNLPVISLVPTLGVGTQVLDALRPVPGRRWLL